MKDTDSTTRVQSVEAHTPTRSEAQDAIMPDSDVRDAANKFCRDHWLAGLRIAGSDSSYTAYWAFCAGAKFRARRRLQGVTHHDR